MDTASSKTSRCTASNPSGSLDSVEKSRKKTAQSQAAAGHGCFNRLPLPMIECYDNKGKRLGTGCWD